MSRTAFKRGRPHRFGGSSFRRIAGRAPRPTHEYTAYGLGFHSALPLPEIPATPGAPADVSIRLEEPRRPSDVRQGGCYVSAREIHYSWAGLGAFRVREGREIVVEPALGVEERLLCLPLLGVALATLLQQRGLLVLHASAVAIGGGAALFLGNKGTGKSTLAAALYGRGHHLLADDVVALDVRDSGTPTLLPGFPQLKLWPDAAAASLGDDPATLPCLGPGYEKRARRVVERFEARPVPVQGLYVLGEGAVPTVRRLPPQETITALIGQSYVAGVLPHALRGDEASAHLRQCARLANLVPMYRLERPRALGLLPEVARLVEEQAAYARTQATPVQNRPGGAPEAGTKRSHPGVGAD